MQINFILATLKIRTQINRKHEILFETRTIWNKPLNILVTLIWNTYSTQSIENEEAI